MWRPCRWSWPRPSHGAREAHPDGWWWTGDFMLMVVDKQTEPFHLIDSITWAPPHELNVRFNPYYLLDLLLFNWKNSMPGMEILDPGNGMSRI
jgi:hypothetical protein